MKSLVLLLVVLILQESVAPPTTKNKEPNKTSEHEGEDKGHFDEIDVEYKRYLEEVVKTLETDPEFRKKLETAEEVDFRNGKVANELEFVHHNVRTKLDEIKRNELNRLRELVKKAQEAQEAGREHEIHPSIFQPPEHLDHSNPQTFEVADLAKLINKVTHDLTEADRRRREEFKEYELQKQFERQQKLNSMDEKHKEEYLRELEEQKKKHNQHEPLHHPGSKAQLEEVWEKQDHMENQEFNPKTFFYLHDLDGNGYWDETEVKALFKKELDKMYQAGAPEDDMKEREEEMERMREHVFKETDTNKDKLISYDEFLAQTKKQEFYQDEGWDPIDPQQTYNQKEYEEFERRRMQEIQKLIDQGLLPPQPHGMGYAPHYQQMPHYAQYPPGHPMPHGSPQQHPYAHQGPPQHGMAGQHPNQLPQGVHQGMGQHPNAIPHGMGQHPNAMPQGMGQHPNAMPQGMGQHPNAMPQGMGQHPNAIPQGMGQHPNAMPQGMGQHPNAMPQSMGQHPNAIPQGMGHHPNAIPQGMGQHPNAIPQGMGQHPNAVPQGMGQHPNAVQQGMGQHPNAVPQGMGQHPNSVPQSMGQHPNAVPQGMGHPNAMSQGQHTGQVQMGMVHPNQASNEINHMPQGVPQYAQHIDSAGMQGQYQNQGAQPNKVQSSNPESQGSQYQQNNIPSNQQQNQNLKPEQQPSGSLDNKQGKDSNFVMGVVPKQPVV